MKQLRRKGDFWLPDEPNIRRSGEITFTQDDGGILELIGTFDVIGRHVSSRPVIVGELVDHKNITLSNCLLTRLTTGESRYRVHYIFIGMTNPDEATPTFKFAYLQLTYLYDWILPRTGIRSYTPDLKDEQFRLSYVRTSLAQAKIGDATLSVELGASVRLQHPDSSIHENAAWCVELASPVTFHEILSAYLEPLRQFLILATGMPNSLEKLIFKTAKAEIVEVEAYYQQVHYAKKSIDYLHFGQMVFGFLDIEDQFESVLQEWFRVTTENGITLKLFERERAAQSLFLDLRLLATSHALEIYHRSQFDSKRDDSVFSELKALLIGASPEASKKWVESVLNNANGKSLYERILELCDGKEELLHILVSDIPTFVHLAKDARNYYTHFSNDKGKKEGLELLLIVETLSILLQSCLLLELGIPIADQVELFKDARQFRFVRENQSTLEALIIGRGEGKST
jgi:hypothetical protein